MYHLKGRPDFGFVGPMRGSGSHTPPRLPAPPRGGVMDDGLDYRDSHSFPEAPSSFLIRDDSREHLRIASPCCTPVRDDALDRLKQLIHEIHRRTLWQVLGLYLAMSWIVVQVVETLTESAGLPDWVPPGALVLLLIGLPIVLGTAFVQEGVGRRPGDAETESAPSTSPIIGSKPAEGAAIPVARASLASGTGSLDRPSTRPPRIARLLTWKNAMIGGVLAFAALGAVVATYWLMWVAGVGPVGSLVAQGALEEAEPVILAAFENGTSDPLLGDLVTSTLRIDLVESPVIQLLEPLAVQAVLQRMGRDPSELVRADLAREIAVREGLKAVIEGEVQAVGSEYLLTATIRAAENGRPLAAFRVRAEDEGSVVEAIDELSQDIRERAGESLRSIRAGVPLENVTTSSLQALRKFTEAEGLTRQGDHSGALTLLEEVIQEDPDFAMAHRRIAVIHYNTTLDPARLIEASTRAYELRDRLTDRERYLAEAGYYTVVLGDREATIQAYRSVLRSHPDDPTALNNLANEYIGWDDEAAIELLRQANEGPGRTNTSAANLVRGLLRLRRIDEARVVQMRYEDGYPSDLGTMGTRYWVHFFAGEFASADSAAAALAGTPLGNAFWRAQGHTSLAFTDIHHGRLREAEAHHLAAARAAAELGPLAHFFEMAIRVGPYLYLEDRARAIRMLEEGLDLFNQIPSIARPYMPMASLLAFAGETDRAEAMIAQWERNVPEVYRSRNAGPDSVDPG